MIYKGLRYNDIRTTNQKVVGKGFCRRQWRMKAETFPMSKGTEALSGAVVPIAN